eukprot:1501310-Amphidinium_carterae.1
MGKLVVPFLFSERCVRLGFVSHALVCVQILHRFNVRFLPCYKPQTEQSKPSVPQSRNTLIYATEIALKLQRQGIPWAAGASDLGSYRSECSLARGFR